MTTPVRKRLLVLCPTFPYPMTSGGDIRIFHLLRRLSRTFEVHLLSRGSGDAAKELMEETGIGAVHKPAHLVDASTLGFLRHQLNFWRYAPHGVSLDVDAGYAATLAGLIETGGFDGVFVDHLYMMQYLPFVADLPVFYSATDVETTKFQRWHGTERLRLKRRLLHWAQQSAVRWHESQLGRRARVTFATSRSDRDFLSRLNGGGRFVVAPNGVDLDYFQPRSRQSFDGPSSVFFVGTMYYKPNYDAASFLARAVLPLVRREIPEATCHLAGKTDTRHFPEFGRPEHGVRMHGFVADIRPYLEQSQVLVVPLFVGSGTRIKILEAMASGTPVVSSSIGAEGIEYSDGDNILIANGAEDTAAAIVRLLRDPDQSFRIGRAGRHLVEDKYSWDATAAVIREEILQVFG